MWTALFVIGSVVVVAIQLAVATVHFDGSLASDSADEIEERLDRELHDWVNRSLD